MKKPFRPLYFFFCLLVCFTPGILGSLAMGDSVSTWYLDINKPSFNPPSWVFGPVWTLLYIMMGISLYLISQHHTKAAQHARLFFIIHLAVNGLWSVVFFGFHQIAASLWVIGVLWLMILISILMFKDIDRRAAILLLPYLAWVSFATVLNASINLLN